MGLFIGIEAGQSRRGCTGATRRTVRLAIDEAGQVVTIDDRRIAVGPDTLVLWHKSDAGTFHGIRCPFDLRTAKAGAAKHLVVGKDIKGVLSESSSSDGHVAALVVKVDRPIAVVTSGVKVYRPIAVVMSGYDGRRGWSLLLVAPDGNKGIVAQKITLVKYRAQFAPVESL